MKRSVLVMVLGAAVLAAACSSSKQGIRGPSGPGQASGSPSPSPRPESNPNTNKGAESNPR